MIGIYEGNIVDYGICLTSSDRPQIFLVCSFADEDGSPKRMTWYGSFHENSLNITFRTLLHCGLSPKMAGKIGKLSDGLASGLLDTDKKLLFDVQEEVDHQDPDKMRTKVKWINDPEMSVGVRKIGDKQNREFFGENETEFSGKITEIAESMGILENGKEPSWKENAKKNLEQAKREKEIIESNREMYEAVDEIEHKKPTVDDLPF